MSRAEVAATRRVLRRVPAAIATWSEGNSRLRPFRLQVLETPLTQLSDAGGGRYWPAPGDVADVITDHASPGEFDSIFVVWPTDGDTPLCGWGCTLGPSAEAQGAGFSAMINDDWRGYATREFAEEGFVHEWPHQVESVYRTLGVGEDGCPGSTTSPIAPARDRRTWPPSARAMSPTRLRPTPGSRGTAT